MGRPLERQAPFLNACSRVKPQWLLSVAVVGAVAVGVGAVANRVGPVLAGGADLVGCVLDVRFHIVGHVGDVRFHRVGDVLGIGLDLVGPVFRRALLARAERGETDRDGDCRGDPHERSPEWSKTTVPKRSTAGTVPSIRRIGEKRCYLFNARTAASVLATCWLKSRSSWTMTMRPRRS